jgi:hypothetical protein
MTLPSAIVPPRAARTGAGRLSLFLLLLALGVAGCASDGATSAHSAASGGPKPSPAVPAKDRVLVQYRQAADAMRQGRLADAKPLLDDALLTLGGLSAGDRSARQARSLFREESRKNFRGEPYERVMAYYYRGILYWMDGEPDNARACFRSAQIQDADAEKNEYQADYVLLDYLDGLVSAKLAGDGSDAYRRAAAAARMATPPAYDPPANIVLFAEMGTGPAKYASGEYRQQLRFRPGQSRAVTAVLRVGPLVLRAPAFDDLSYQATTRGGRVMDHVLANKAVFKDTTSGIGDAAVIGGAIMATQTGRNSAMDEAGLGLLAAGLILKGISAATTPTADTRTWDNLPNLLAFGSGRLAPGDYTGTLEFADAGGTVVKARPVRFTVAPGRDTVLFVSDRD